MGLTDYNVYIMDKRKKLKYTVIAAFALFLPAILFFDNIVIAALIALGSIFYPKYKAGELLIKRKAELNLQFKDALYSLSSSLGVGRSLESSFKCVLSDLRMLYPADDTHIIRELMFICRSIELNEPVENALADFAQRSGLEDVKNFADVVMVCKRTGGNLVQVAKNSAAIIGDKIEISQDIELLLSRQKYEQKILNIMPVVFVALIRYGGSGYMDALYSSIRGYLVIAVALAILAASHFVSKKILDIRV